MPYGTRILITLGSLLILIGLLYWFLSAFKIPLGRLPGDIVIKGENSRFYFPLTSSLLISALLSLLAFLFHYFKR